MRQLAKVPRSGANGFLIRKSVKNRKRSRRSAGENANSIQSPCASRYASIASGSSGSRSLLARSGAIRCWLFFCQVQGQLSHLRLDLADSSLDVRLLDGAQLKMK